VEAPQPVELVQRSPVRMAYRNLLLRPDAFLLHVRVALVFLHALGLLDLEADLQLAP
jgi:hypothetical protein